MIYYRKKRLISMAEIWYKAEEKPEKKTDILRYKFADKKKENAASLEELYTLLLDLSNDEDALFSKIRKNTRYEINRAKNKDNLRAYSLFEQNTPTPPPPTKIISEKIEQYIDFFNKFAASKGRQSISFSDIEQFYYNRTFCVRCVTKEDDPEFLTCHAYVISDDTARLHQSSSLFRETDDQEYRNFIGRANRFLHWEDILYFKKMGLRWYDFGGWYGGEDTTGTYKEQLQINVFKESFGGEKKQEYSYIVPVTLKGKAAVYLRGIIKHAP